MNEWQPGLTGGTGSVQEKEEIEEPGEGFQQWLQRGGGSQERKDAPARAAKTDQERTALIMGDRGQLVQCKKLSVQTA